MIDEKDSSAWVLIFGCWVIAVVATLGSLFFSEVMRFQPCAMCWYQRIAMYPLVVVFLAGLFPLERRVFKYSFPLALIGWGWAVYHNLLHYNIVPESASPCVQGVPCSTVYINWLGFITIPALSFAAFSMILVLLIVFYRKYCR